MKLTFSKAYALSGEEIKIGDVAINRRGVEWTLGAILPDQTRILRRAKWVNKEGDIVSLFIDGSLDVGRESDYDIMHKLPPEIPYPWEDFPLAEWAFMYGDNIIFGTGEPPDIWNNGYAVRKHTYHVWQHPTPLEGDYGPNAESLRMRPEEGKDK